MRWLGPEVLHDVARAARLEWLQADGLGGWASSSVLGLNSRRYHSLLVVATAPPVGRVNLLSRVDEQLCFEDGTPALDLATNQYAGAIHPDGFRFAESFALDPLPRLAFATPRGRLVKTVARVHGTSAVVVQYEWDGVAPAELRIRPLLAYREEHALQHERADLRRDVANAGDAVLCAPLAGWPALGLRVAGATWEDAGYWYRDFEYAQERARGLDSREDLWSPGCFRAGLRAGRPVTLLAAADGVPAGDPGALFHGERRRQLLLSAGAGGLEADLRRAADAFVVRRGRSGCSVIAGYPWFADWGRDTMIALPGLCLATGRLDDARAVLREYAAHVDHGLVPNRFPDRGEPPVYDAVDASLWFVLAVQRLREADPSAPRERLLDLAVDRVIDSYAGGTAHGIRMREDGLVEAGAPGLALTWMDARVGAQPVTPRHGCAVEIQALWHNALLVGAEVARARGDEPRAIALGQVAARCRDAVQRLFWSEERGHLADVVGFDGRPDFSLRPNQLYAIGLPHGLLPRDRAERVLQVVEARLLTPRGLRTLAPSQAGYRGRYAGSAVERDGACHQGSAWPFLIGVWVDARMRLLGEAGKPAVHEWLAGFGGHLEEAGLGHVGELFDGDPPHAPGGAIAQAWSAAELLRALRRAGRPPRVDAARSGR